MANEPYEPESDESAFPAAVKRIALIALAACVAIWLLLIAANSWAKATAQDYDAVGRVVWAHDVSGEWQGKRKPYLSGHRGWSLDGVGIQLDGRDEPIEYTRPKPSKLGDFAPGDRVRVRYTEGGWSVWRHFQVRDVSKLDAATERTP